MAIYAYDLTDLHLVNYLIRIVDPNRPRLPLGLAWCHAVWNCGCVDGCIGWERHPARGPKLKFQLANCTEYEYTDCTALVDPHSPRHRLAGGQGRLFFIFCSVFIERRKAS